MFWKIYEIYLRTFFWSAMVFSIDITVLETDDKNERSGSMVHHVPLPIDDDDSFMPPSSRDSRGQLLVHKEVKYSFALEKFFYVKNFSEWQMCFFDKW